MRRLSVLFSLILFFHAVSPAVGKSPAKAPEEESKEGKLDRFEEGASEKKENESAENGRKNRRDEKDCESDDGEEDYEAGEVILNVALSTIYGGVGSWVRTFGSNSKELNRYFPLRQPGDPLIPFLALEGFLHEAGADIAALNLRAEAGCGPFGVEFRTTRFTEESPDDALTVRQVHGLYRMSFSRNVEIDFGVGTTWLLGNSQVHGRSVTVPLRIYATRGLGFEVRPSWAWIGGNTLSDVSVLLAGHLDYVAIKAGYRRLAVSGVTLDGPVIGVSVSL